MTWKARHEGSPQSVSLTLDELRQGLVDGQWEPTDEVMGPGDADWVPIEGHPALAELAEELEPPPPKQHPDESHIDMTALIDVCLVLLVFFILTTTVAAMQKRIAAPTAEDNKKVGVARLTKEQVERTMIHVTAKLERPDQVVIRVEGKVVDAAQLPGELRRLAKAAKRTRLLLEHDDDVPHEVIVQILDAATGAQMESVGLLLPEPGK
jgi:biopolymer transport protein ExbD